MKKTELKSFDIATYDVEIEFNKKIAPIQKKIEKLDEQHETKSLKAHKDFLSREETSKNKIIEIDEKQILKHQRIEKAAENKLIKLRRKDQVIKQSFQDYKVAQHAANQIELDEVKARILELNDEQAADILVISTKYKQKQM